MKRCTDKQRYPDQLAAMTALSRLRLKGRSEKRVYRCNYCRGWHATGRPRRMPSAGTWPDAPAGIA